MKAEKQKKEKKNQNNKVSSRNILENRHTSISDKKSTYKLNI